MQIIGQIVEILNLLLGTTRGEREELVDDYKHQFNTLVELVINIQRIVDGKTPYGRQIKWGYHLWQLHTYKRQHGLTLQAGWDDVVDFGIRLGEIIKVVVPRNYSYRPSPSVATGHSDRVNVVSDICEFDCRPQLQRLALREAVVNLSSQSSSEDSSVNNDVYAYIVRTRPDELEWCRQIYDENHAQWQSTTARLEELQARAEEMLEGTGSHATKGVL